MSKKKHHKRSHARRFDLAEDTPVQDRYERNARVLRVVDGDTLELIVDQGFGSYYQGKFRLAGVNTPEKYGVKKESEEYKAGVAASTYAEEWLDLNAEAKVIQSPTGPVTHMNIVIRSFDAGRGKYGRWICSVHPAGGEGESLNQALVRTGHAVEIEY